MSKDSIEKLIQVEAEKLAATMATVKPEPGKSIYQVGAKLYIRTVTFHFTGRVSYLSADEIVLDDAAWVADSGRFAKALETGELSEVEPYPGMCSIGRGAVVDASPWDHELPRSVK